MRKIPDDVQHATAHTLVTLNENKMHDFAMEVINALTYRKDPEKIMNFKLVERLLYYSLFNLDDDRKKKIVENTNRLLEHEPLDISTEVNVKALVMTGEYDIYTRPEYCEEIAKSIRNSVFVTI